MTERDDVPGPSQLDYEAWTETLRPLCGRYHPEDNAPSGFSGWVQALDVWGFKALNIGSNAAKVERTHRDVRLDCIDHYFVLFQLSGRATLTHNDQVVQLSAGDAVLVDSARPALYLADNGSDSWNKVRLNLPRPGLASHLGFVPQGGSFQRGDSPAGRLLLDLILNSNRQEASTVSATDSYMQLAIYDLVGALFAPSQLRLASRPTDKLFERMRALAVQRIEDPDFGPVALASAAGISLRYAQKLFTTRGLTCSGFIYELRLAHAARLLQRRALLRAAQPISEIAYACGFRDYSHFARKFRQRFGCPPGATSVADRSRERTEISGADGSSP